MEDNHSRFGTHIYLNQPIKLVKDISLSLQIGRTFLDLCFAGKKAPPCGCLKTKNPMDSSYSEQLSKQQTKHAFYTPLHLYFVDMNHYELLQKKYAPKQIPVEDKAVEPNKAALNTEYSIDKGIAVDEIINNVD